MIERMASDFGEVGNMGEGLPHLTHDLKAGVIGAQTVEKMEKIGRLIIPQKPEQPPGKERFHPR